MSEKSMAQVPPSRSTATADIRPAERPLLILLCYGATYFALRLAVDGTLERDEAEIVYLVQELHPGYGPQPPLYAWLQWLAFETFGLNWFGLLILKDVLLMGSYFCMARAAHPLVGPQAALAAAAALALSPQIGWEGPRIQTHSVLVVTLSCATLWCYVALLGKASLPRYAMLGLLCGLGLQAKYNYGFLLAGLVVASLLVPEHRRALWTRGMALAVGGGRADTAAARRLGRPASGCGVRRHTQQDAGRHAGWPLWRTRRAGDVERTAGGRRVRPAAARGAGRGRLAAAP